MAETKDAKVSEYEEVKGLYKDLLGLIEKQDLEIKSLGAPKAETAKALEAANARIDELEKKSQRPAMSVAEAYAAPVVATKVGASEMKSFFSLMREGKSGMQPSEFKKLALNATGEILVPEELEKEIRRALPPLTVVRPLCSSIKIESDRIRTRSMDEVEMAWGSLEAATSPTIHEKSLTPTDATQYVEPLYGLTKIGELELQMSDVNLQPYVADSFSRAIAKMEDTAFITGTGHVAEMPVGMLNGTTLSRVAAAQTAAVTIDDFIELTYALDARYRKNGAFIVNSKTEAVMRKLKDENKQYYWQPSVQLGRPSTFLGYPVYNQEDVPDVPSIATAEADVAIFGDYKAGYRIVDHDGLGLKRLDEMFALQGLVGFKMHYSVGGGIIRPEAIKVLHVPKTA